MSYWTDKRVATLKKLWADGLSASQIASRLGGVTRSAVIGKVHRLELAGGAVETRNARPRPRKPRGDRFVKAKTEVTVAETRISTPEPAPPPPPQPEPEPAHGGRRTILTLTEHTCKWPIGDVGEKDFHFCGAAKSAGTGPYCEHHAKRAYTPAGLQAALRAKSSPDWSVQKQHKKRTSFGSIASVAAE